LTYRSVALGGLVDPYSLYTFLRKLVWKSAIDARLAVTGTLRRATAMIDR